MRIEHASIRRRIHKAYEQRDSGSLVRLTGYVIVFALLSLVGVLFQEVTFGEILIVLYGLVALAMGVRSEETYKMALIALVCIPLLTLLHSDVLAEAFAVYAFLLLCIGTASALKEQVVMAWQARKAPRTAPEVSPIPTVEKPVAPLTPPVVARPRIRPEPQPQPYKSRKQVVFENRRERAKRRIINAPL